MKLSFKTILPIILISALLILLAGCVLPDESPGLTPDEGEEECEDLIANAGGCYCATVCPDTDALIDLNGSGSSGTGPLSYAWDLDDDGSFDDSTLQNPQDIPFSVGSHTVSLQVTDDCGNKATATTSVDVSITDCINHAPELVSPSRQAISAVSYGGSCIPTYKYTVVATDPDSNNLKFSLVANSYGHIPSGMVINEDTGVITWTPECCDGATRCHLCCTECVKVKVVDDGCCGPLFDEMEFCIEVWNGWIDDGDYVGIGFDGCPIGKYSCP